MAQKKRRMFSCWLQVEIYDYIEARKTLYGGSQSVVVENAIVEMEPAHFAQRGVIPGERFEHKFGDGDDSDDGDRKERGHVR